MIMALAVTPPLITPAFTRIHEYAQAVRALPKTIAATSRPADSLEFNGQPIVSDRHPATSNQVDHLGVGQAGIMGKVVDDVLGVLIT